MSNEEYLEFDFDGFREALGEYWSHKRSCKTLCWYLHDRDDGILDIEVCPPKQEIYGGPDDGEIQGVPFEFNLGDFFQEDDLEVVEFGAFSENPSVFVTGKYKDAPFMLRIYLTPQSDAVYEKFNTLNGEATPLEQRK